MRKEKGITLIALIITIIVMLILVGVTVNVALNGGLFTKAKEAADQTKIEIAKENLLQAVYGAMGKNGQIDFSVLDANLPEGFEGTDGNYTIKGNKFIVDPDGEIIVVDPEVEKIIAENDEEANYWITDGNGTILDYEPAEGVEVPETLVVPCQIGNEKITTIGAGALCAFNIKRNDDGTAVLGIYSGLPEIDENNFDTDENGMPIGRKAASKAKTIIISKGIETIENGAFLACTKLEKVNMPSSIKVIEHGTFAYCTSLTNVIIPDGVEKIGAIAFTMCNSLTSMIIPKGVTRLEDGIFLECQSLKKLIIGSDITDAIVDIGNTSLEKVIIKEGVTTVGESAFRECKTLKEVILPEGVTTIGRGAFENCTSLKSIYVPETVDNMGYAAFWGWTKDQTIKMGKTEEPALESSQNPYTEIGWEYNWRYECNAKVLWKGEY